MSPSPSDPTGEAGFSLIESVVTVAILGIVTVAMLLSLTRATATAQFADDRNVALDQMRTMAAEFTKDVRQAVRATAIAANAVTLDTYVAGTLQSVTWQVTSSGGTDQFERRVGLGTPVVHVVDLTTTDVFDFQGATTAGEVERVGLSLATQPDPRHPAVELSTVVEMRNVP